MLESGKADLKVRDFIASHIYKQTNKLKTL